MTPEQIEKRRVQRERRKELQRKFRLALGKVDVTFIENASDRDASITRTSLMQHGLSIVDILLPLHFLSETEEQIIRRARVCAEGLLWLAHMLEGHDHGPREHVPSCKACRERGEEE